MKKNAYMTKQELEAQVNKTLDERQHLKQNGARIAGMVCLTSVGITSIIAFAWGSSGLTTYFGIIAGLCMLFIVTLGWWAR